MLRPTSPSRAMPLAQRAPPLASRWKWSWLTGRTIKRRDRRLRRVSAALANGLFRHPFAGFQQRLEIAEDPRPAAAALVRLVAAAHHAGDERGARGVVGEGEGAEAALVLPDLPCEARRGLGDHLAAELRMPRLHELARRIAFVDLAEDDLVRKATRLHFRAALVEIRAAFFQLVGHAPAIGVALRPFGLGDCIPDRLRLCLDVELVHLHGRGFVRHARQSSFSSSVLSARSAETLGSVYLSIHRS